MSLTLSDICEYRTETTTLSDIDSYLSTESMLPNKQGITRSSALPDQNKFRIYRCGDTLVSNIRPYFKKIWQADHDGTCSADVLVFKPVSYTHLDVYKRQITCSAPPLTGCPCRSTA